MEEEEMYVVNTDTMSRMGEGGNRLSNIDLMFCSENIHALIDYTQEEDTWGSDHYSIIFTMGTNRSPYKKITNRISSKKTDWKTYAILMKEKEEILDTREYKEMSREEKYNKIVEWIKEATIIAIHGKQERKTSAKHIDSKQGNEQQPNKKRKERKPVDWWDRVYRSNRQQEEGVTRICEDWYYGKIHRIQKNEGDSKKDSKRKKKRQFQKFHE